ncbi:MAG: hypothetical protein ACYDDA_06405 [Acidiferrobacteraceae bacterium]
MKTSMIAVVSLLAVVSPYPVNAGTTQSQAAQMAACFRQHSYLMDKPAVRTIQACWWAHGYLMARR